jgi:Ca2+-binding RTX toxin-like protein
VFVTLLSLAAFQVLAIIGAGSAFAIAACTYNPATDTINITLDPGDSGSVAVENDAAAALDTESTTGAILFTADSLTAGGVFDYENGALSTQCGSATTSNTVAIIVLGQPSADEFFAIDEYSGGRFASTTTWALDLGSNTVGGVDELDWYGSDGGGSGLPFADTVVNTDTSFDINGGVGEHNGVEFLYNYGGDGDDVLNGSAMSSVIYSADGVGDDDVVSPGAQATLPFALFGEVYTGGPGIDCLDYSMRTTTTVIDNTNFTSGRDANGDGDVLDVGDESDSQFTFECKETGSGNDFLIGAVGVIETFIPGDGDDTITGQVGDTIDWSSSSAGMIIDLPNGTATGQGMDGFTGVANFVGSPFDDTMITDGDAPGPAVLTFSGGAGVDTVDGSAETTPTFIDLDALDPTPDDLENALGGSSDDDIEGNDQRNRLEGNAGDDDLFGDEGNDTMIGGTGNDDFFGGAGADTTSFATNTTDGVDVDVVLGFATSNESGDDSFTDLVEIINGSPFDDTITGGGGLVTINFLFTGAAGDDILTGSGSNDLLKGGGGDDIVRAGAGDDTVVGAGGDDLLVGGQGFDIGKGGKGDDVCKGVESEKSCGTKKNPAKVQLASLRARLV